MNMQVSNIQHKPFCISCILLFLFYFNVSAQSATKDSSNFDYVKINTLALDANIAEVLNLLALSSEQPFTDRSIHLKSKYQERFLANRETDDYISERHSPLDGLLGIYTIYWKAALLHPKDNCDTLLTKSLSAFLTDKLRLKEQAPEDSIDRYLTQYITQLGYHTTGYGKTGKLLDLLVWGKQQDTTYSFLLQDEVLNVKVVFMDDFITLGWEEFATFGKSYPGGWATRDALYCVREAYDLKSENFLVSYLAHEGNHFADYKKFPLLSSTDLEYRAKLIELSLARETIYKTINFFIKNANAESDNPHSVANYYVIRNLSKSLFGVAFENELQQWQKVKPERINQAAKKLYYKNTKTLKEKNSASILK